MFASLLIGGVSFGQIKSVSLQASGLTCSMCSNAINKALKTLDFVENVNPNIKTSTFEITFKPNSSVDFDKLKDKVEDAGFFVSKFLATIRFDNVQVKSNSPVTIGDKTFKFLNADNIALNGDKQVRLLDKGFVPAKEYKRNSFGISTGNNERVYHATI
ncbi:MAG: heavy-metal-associated protein [Chitinophagaceae bacterium]|nr:heavy-metal-associated protein [Chitinophagaceae bacterium]